jgi:hypothetical protein
MPMITELKNCRVCGSDNIEKVLDLGSIFPSGFLKPDEKLSEENKAPLVLCKCAECGLVQLGHTVDLDLMYRQYWYSSSLNKSMVRSLQDVVADIMAKEGRVLDDDIVVDIGCNDGTMLSMFPTNCKKIGFDPALNLKTPDNCTFINDYFSAELYNKATVSKASVVTAIAMFYDLPDPVGFAKDVSSILADDGIFMVQFTDLLSMFRATAFDNICHEHLEYYRLVDVVEVLNSAGLRVIDVSYNDVNGGSVRVTAVHRESNLITSEHVVKSLVDEWNYFSTHDFDSFSEKVAEIKTRTRTFLDWAKDNNKKVHLFGASTKGNTYLQYCGITNKDIPFASEVNVDKFGLHTAGSDIEIVSEADSFGAHPDFYVVPVWHFKQSILTSTKMQQYLLTGGSLVFPMPTFTIVTKEGELIP